MHSFPHAVGAETDGPEALSERQAVHTREAEHGRSVRPRISAMEPRYDPDGENDGRHALRLRENSPGGATLLLLHLVLPPFSFTQSRNDPRCWRPDPKIDWNTLHPDAAIIQGLNHVGQKNARHCRRKKMSDGEADSDEEELTFDEHGRTAVDGTCNYRTRAWDEAIPRASVPALVADCEAAYVKVTTQTKVRG